MENEDQTEQGKVTDQASRTVYVSKKNEKADRQGQRERSKKWRSQLSWIIPLIIIGGISIWLFTLPRKPESPTVKGKNHIHADLVITIDGERFPIPGGIGLLAGGGTTHIPGAQKIIHTHVENDQLHIEAVGNGPLHEDDTKVSTFFGIWGKEFNATTILDHTTLSGGVLQFKVNGVDNMEFQNYQMRDGDKLEIIFMSDTSAATMKATTTKPL